MKIDEKVYVLKEDVEKSYILKSEVEEKYVHRDDVKSEKKTGFKVIKPLLKDENYIMAIGTTEVGDDAIVGKYSTERIEKAIKIVKNLSYSKKGLENIHLIYNKNQPLILGTLDEKSGKASGVILAPIVKILTRGK